MLSDAERRALASQDAALLPLPLRMGPEPHSMAAHLRQVVRLLRSGGRSPCREAVTYLTALYGRSIQPFPGIACRKGCAHCCVQTVLVTAAEAFAVAAELGGRQVTFGPARRLGEPHAAWRPCALLDMQGACSIYAARPLGCHSFVSLDLAACIAFFDQGAQIDLAMPTDHVRMLALCRMMLNAAHAIIGRGEQPGYELGAAVSAIMAIPEAETRWLAGENVLAAVPCGPPVPAFYAQEIARMAAFVGSTLDA